MSETSMSLGAKESAVEQWSADPCGSDRVDGAPGSAAYAEDLLAMRAEYAPWMADSLDYSGADGLDVLDVGCGQGIDLVNYARAGARATGLDLTPRLVELARAHLEALGHDGTVVHGDAEAMPFADASFDRVSSNGVLHHTPNMDRALAEVARVLRPGGWFVGTDSLGRGIGFWLLHIGDTKVLVPPAELPPRLAAAGLRDVRVSTHEDALRFSARR
jgi:SAM-dependent methyltransferase